MREADCQILPKITKLSFIHSFQILTKTTKNYYVCTYLLLRDAHKLIPRVVLLSSFTQYAYYVYLFVPISIAELICYINPSRFVCFSFAQIFKSVKLALSAINLHHTTSHVRDLIIIPHKISRSSPRFPITQSF